MWLLECEKKSKFGEEPYPANNPVCRSTFCVTNLLLPVRFLVSRRASIAPKEAPVTAPQTTPNATRLPMASASFWKSTSRFAISTSAGFVAWAIASSLFSANHLGSSSHAIPLGMELLSELLSGDCCWHRCWELSGVGTLSLTDRMRALARYVVSSRRPLAKAVYFLCW